MFEGDKSSIFWAGLFLLGGCLFGLFSTLWFMLVFDYRYTWRFYIPLVFGFVVFLVIGYYMMRTGVKAQGKS